MFKICTYLDVTEVHKLTLEAICNYILTHKQSPTVREIACITGRSLLPTQISLNLLREKGYLTWEEGKARTMLVLLHKL